MAKGTLEDKQGIISYCADTLSLVLIKPIREKRDFKIVGFDSKASAEATRNFLREGGLGSSLENYEIDCSQMDMSDDYKLVFLRIK